MKETRADSNFKHAVRFAQQLEPDPSVLEAFLDEEGTNAYWMGCADNKYRGVLYLIVQGGRHLCSLNYEETERLLQEALHLLEGRKENL